MVIADRRLFPNCGEPTAQIVGTAIEELRGILDSEQADPIHECTWSVSRLSDAITWVKQRGVTRIGEATSLDRLGWSYRYTVRPTALHPLCILSSAAGLTPEDALGRAAFEAAERWAAERFERLCVRSTAKSLETACSGKATVLPPPDYEGQTVRWALGYAVPSFKPTWVPLQAVVFPRPTDEPHLLSIGGE